VVVFLAIQGGFKMDQALRPMSTSQVLDRTFSLYRNNFVLFLGIALITPALKLVAGMGQLALFGRLVVPQGGSVDPHVMQQFMLRSLIGFGVAIVIYVIGTAFASSATVYAVSMVHLGKSTTIRESYGKIRSIVGRIIGVIARVSFIAFWPILAGYGLILLAGLFALSLGKKIGISGGILVGLTGLLALVLILVGLVWMFIAFCRYALAVPACTLERLPVKASLIRSKFLSKGRKGGIFLIYILTGIIAIALNYAFEIPALLTGGVAWVSASAQASMAIGALIWVYVATFLAGALAGPIATIAIALIYYDERVRKEAFDLQLMMEAIGMPKPAQAQAQAAGGSFPTIG
jgi:hypothetical protein